MAKRNTVVNTAIAYVKHKWGQGGLSAIFAHKQLNEMETGIKAACDAIDNMPAPTTVIANPELVGTEAELTSLQVGATKYKVDYATVQTTAPSEAITDGKVHIVILDSTPATEYNGYIYLIKES